MLLGTILILLALRMGSHLIFLSGAAARLKGVTASALRRHMQSATTKPGLQRMTGNFQGLAWSTGMQYEENMRQATPDWGHMAESS